MKCLISGTDSKQGVFLLKKQQLSMSGLLVSDRHENIDTLFADHHQHTYIYLIVKGKSWASRSIATIGKCVSTRMGTSI